MKTIAIQIGNTDNKLSQQRWAEYCDDIHLAIVQHQGEVHFSAPSVGWADWQNSAWIFSVEESYIHSLRRLVIAIREKYSQESLAWMMCDEAEFI